jgi:hypothetical protein
MMKKDDWTTIGKFLSVAIQLGLLVLVARQFQLENQTFYEKIMPLAFGGFLIHYFLPQRYRLTFFIALSLAGIYAALGFPNGFWLLGLGLLFIGLCHLPIPFVLRVSLLMATAIGLMFLRTQQIKVSWASAVLPILASMFMFRLIIYLYDLKHQKGKFSLQHTLAYFFLLPNVVFPLFPVVDYGTFRRTYYDGDRHRIYQKGIDGILLGILLLILYRYINYYWAIAPEDVRGLGSLAQYVTANNLLVLRMMGQFTLIVGMLRLFGFNLPAAMLQFFFIPSFTEYWRRANVYWKDFVQKVFFYPVYFQLRRFDATLRLVMPLAMVFILTWFLHAYQWFWIKGAFLFSVPDMLFWGIFGVVVVVNSVYENKHARQRASGESGKSLLRRPAQALRAMGLFAFIAVLWSLWTSPSLAEWISLWSNTKITMGEVRALLPALVLAFFVFLAGTLLFERTSPRATENNAARSFRQARLASFGPVPITGVLIVLLFLLGKPALFLRLNGSLPEAIRDLQTARLNYQEAELLTRGYYENINLSNQFNTPLGDLYAKRPDNWPSLRETPAGRLTGDFMRDEIVPSVRIVFHGSRLSTNRWAMRDKDYEKKKPEHTYRIAVLGASHVFGSGVADNETFEWLLEERLNRESGQIKYEILNFACPSYSPLHGVMVLEKKVLEFEPDAAFLVVTPLDDFISTRHLATIAIRGVDIPYQGLREIVQKAGINTQTTENDAVRILKRYGDELLFWAYPRFAEMCRQHGIRPVYIYTPVLQKVKDEPEKEARFMRCAKEAGVAMINISHAYENHQSDSLRVAEWDWHPNAEGHRLLADRLYKALRTNPEILGLAMK